MGPNEHQKIWERHIINCSIFFDQISGNVLDIGSGSGLPGICLAIARGDARFTLLEPMKRRYDWLCFVQNELNLTNINILCCRVEDYKKTKSFDIITSRAVFSLSELIKRSHKLLKRNGRFLIIKGQKAEEEIKIADNLIKKNSLKDVHILEYCLETNIPISRIISARMV